MHNARDGALTWLNQRQDGVPTALKTAVYDAVNRVDGSVETPEAVLRAAADLLLGETVSARAGTDPVVLLAADALITYVCEYRSEFQPDELDALL